MGLIVPQTVRIKTNSITCKHYREKRYEFKKCGDFIEVNVMDLYPGSHEKVKIICDICGNESEIEYRHFIKNRKKGVLVTCGSNSCKNKKYEDTCMKKYGVKNVFQSEEVKEKIKDTNLGRYGAKNPFGSKEIRDKIKDTWQKNYGENITNPGQAQDVKDKIRATWQKNYGEDITCPFQVESVKNKIKDTNLGRYGVENPFGSKEIQNKIKDTNLERYGVEYPMQSNEIKDKIKKTNEERYGCCWYMSTDEFIDKSKQTLQEKYGENIINIGQVEEIKNKILSSFQFNGTGPSSRAQRYINYILNGILNKHILNFMVDIYLEKENLIVEYDGSGHFLGDTIKNKSKFPSKEAILKEKAREDKLINNNYKLIRIIAKRDRIPSDEVILNLIDEFKNSDFKIIRIDIDEGTISKDDTEKWNYNFGELRKITKEDLEKFENNNRLEN